MTRYAVLNGDTVVAIHDVTLVDGEPYITASAGNDQTVEVALRSAYPDDWTFRPAGANAQIGWRLQGTKLVEPPVPPAPDPATLPVPFTYKVDLFRRATDAECDKIEGALTEVSSKMRRLFEGAIRLEHNAEEFLVLQAAAIQMFGQARADALLAPSA